MATDREIIKAGLKGIIGGIASLVAANDASDALHRRPVAWSLNDAATAGTAVTETVVATMPRRGFVKSVNLATPVAVTANDTNYATVNVYKKTGASAHVLIATCQTKITAGTGNLTALVPVALTLTATAAQFAASDVLTVEVVKTGSGVALTAATSLANVTIDYEEN